MQRRRFGCGVSKASRFAFESGKAGRFPYAGGYAETPLQ
jgi:hypothetical protein